MNKKIIGALLIIAIVASIIAAYEINQYMFIETNFKIAVVFVNRIMENVYTVTNNRDTAIRLYLLIEAKQKINITPQSEATRVSIDVIIKPHETKTFTTNLTITDTKIGDFFGQNEIIKQLSQTGIVAVGCEVNRNLGYDV